MIEFNFAYRILGNPDRRKIYDRLGLRGVLFVEKYGGAKLLTWFFKTRLDGACFLIMSGLICCYCFGEYSRILNQNSFRFLFWVLLLLLLQSMLWFAKET